MFQPAMSTDSSNQIIQGGTDDDTFLLCHWHHHFNVDIMLHVFVDNFNLVWGYADQY